MQHTTCDMRRATCDVQRATCNMQHATCNMLRCSPARTPAKHGSFREVVRSKSPRRSRGSKAQTCNMQHATCNMQHAACSMQHATCNMQHATCDMQHATPRARLKNNIRAIKPLSCSSAHFDRNGLAISNGPKALCLKSPSACLSHNLP